MRHYAESADMCEHHGRGAQILRGLHGFLGDHTGRRRGQSGRMSRRRDQVHLALPGRESAGQAPTDLGSPEGHEPEGGQGLGHEGKLGRVVELPQRRLGQTVHETLADLGEEVRPDTDAQGRGDALPAPGQHPDLLPASDHQRRGRGTQQQDHGHQAQSLRLQEPGALQDRHLLLLRRLGPLSQAGLTPVTHGKPGRTP